MVQLTCWDMTMARGKRGTVSSCASFLEGPTPHWLALGDRAISKPLANKGGLGPQQVALMNYMEVIELSGLKHNTCFKVLNILFCHTSAHPPPNLWAFIFTGFFVEVASFSHNQFKSLIFFKPKSTEFLSAGCPVSPSLQCLPSWQDDSA